MMYFFLSFESEMKAFNNSVLENLSNFVETFCESFLLKM